MAYSDFTYPSVISQLGLKAENDDNLFESVPSVEASKGFLDTMAVNSQLGTNAHTEFSRAVWLIGPVLSDFWRRYRGKITLIAGVELNADKEAGLVGYCDFAIGLAPHQHILTAPVLVIVEAKRDCIPDGLGQCIASMVGAQRYNRKHGTLQETIYGCVTTGNQWKFLRLVGNVVTLDLTEYQHRDYEKILGILTHIVGPVPDAIAA